MQKKSIFGLMYKDWYLGKKTFKMNLIFGLLTCLLGITLVLSMNYGNLRLLPEGEIKDLISWMLLMFVRLMPVFSFATLGMGFVDDFVKPEKKEWQMFRMTTPVSAYRYAGAKYMLAFGVSLSGILFAMLYMFLIVTMTNDTFSSNYIANIFLVGFAGSFMIIIMGVFTQLFGSQDKGALAFVGVMFVVICSFMKYAEGHGDLFGITMGDTIDPQLVLNGFENFVGSKLGILFLMYLGIHVLGYFVTVFIYKRREK